MRAYHTNNCPVGITTQRKDLRSRIIINQSDDHLKNYLEATIELMKVLARACGHGQLNKFNIEGLTTFNNNLAKLSGVRFNGVEF